MVSKWNPWALFDGTIYTLGLDRVEMNILLFSLVLFFLVDLIRYHLEKTINQFVSEQNLWFFWTWFIGMVVIIFIFGMYGSGFDAKQFIYFQF